jgi:hypothetical protein
MSQTQTNRQKPNQAPHKLKHLGRLFENIEQEDPCPKCGSFYVLKSECESCGFRFHLDIVGEPMGERSLYTFRDDYLDDCPIGWRHYSLDMKAKYAFYRSYKRKLTKRFSDLVQVLDQGKLSDDVHSYFMMECRHIIEEYDGHGENVQDLSLYLKNCNLLLLAHDIRLCENDTPKTVKTKKQSFIVSLFSLSFTVIAFFFVLFRFLIID